MSVLALLLEASGLLGFTWWLLARYRDPHVSPVGLAAVFLSWSLGFLGLLLLPIDMARHATTTSGSESHGGDEIELEDDGHSDDRNADLPHFLHVWEALYWLTFALSWLVLPLLVEFAQNGEFHAEKRITNSLRRLVLHWTILVGVAVVVTIYLLFVGHFTGRGLLGLAMASANTYGLVWLIVLLGYGLADIPRSLWTLRHPERRLRALYFRATQVYHERMETVFLYQDVVQDARSCYDRTLFAESASIILTSDMQEIKAGLLVVMALVGDNQPSGRDGYTKTCTTSTTTTTTTTTATTSSTSQRSPMLSTSTLRLPPPTYSEVVELHRRVKATQADLRGTEQAWHELCLRAESLQQRLATYSRSSPPVGIYSSTNVLSQIQALIIATATQTQRFVWPSLWAIASVVAALYSLCILWGELTMGWSDQFSLIRVLSWLSSGSSSASSSSSVLEMLAFTLLLFMVLCAYSSLFKLRSFGRFALRGHRNSSEIALLKTSIHQCRLQFALGYNFQLLVHTPALTEHSAFHHLWSRMQVVRVLGRDFSVYAPVLMVVLVGCTLTNVYARVMKSVVGMEQYEQLLDGHADHEAQITKGEQLIQKGLEKMRRERARSASTRAETPKETQWRGRGFKTPKDMAASLLDSHNDDSVDGVA